MTEPPQPEPSHSRPSASATASHKGVSDDDLARRFAYEALCEQRRTRRWGIFFKLLVLVYVLAFVAISRPDLWEDFMITDDRITALVDLKGVIADDAGASADTIVKGLRAAFEHRKTAGVILRINSPGGSPVQAGYINDEIYRLKDKYPEIPVYAVIEDVCASGGYYAAVAADEIYADKASIVGSIGVRFDGFGFVEAMEKLGIERRLLTAGDHKGFLDPFLPANPEDVTHITGVLKEIHEQFINTVRRGRGDRLVNDPKVFSGLVWSGEGGLALGLVDALGSSGYVAREIIGAEEIVNFTPHRDILEQLARHIGAQIVSGLSTLSAHPR